MTYLGYQVKHLETCNNDLQEWLEKNENPISVWGIPVIGSGCDYGTNPEDYPWENEAVYCFKELENGCSFTTSNESFTVTICDLPSDKWALSYLLC